MNKSQDIDFEKRGEISAKRRKTIGFCMHNLAHLLINDSLICAIFCAAAMKTAHRSDVLPDCFRMRNFLLRFFKKHADTSMTH